MLVKEYRIPMPLTVEEYRIAQLYMILKKSREESSGAGNGVEIVVNEPYENGPGGNGGQYTYKIFHVANHLPAWLRSVLPSTVRVEEEAWNAYPYTKTRYTCPFVEKFFIEIETKYFNDAGTIENVFDLTESDLRIRSLDVIDIVNDPISAGDYVKNEDPKTYKSQKTRRGPLSDDWIQNSAAIMCAYKLCKVEFRYWGMQSKIEKFIHDFALRKTMHRAHRQAWAWQDEWYGLTMADIRRLEKEVQDILRQKVTALNNISTILIQFADQNDGNINETLTEEKPNSRLGVDSNDSSQHHSSLRTSQSGTNSSRDGLSNNVRDHFKSILRTDSDSEDEFFDAPDVINSDGSVYHDDSLVRWSSVEILDDSGDFRDEQGLVSPLISPRQGDTSSACSIELLILIFHGGSVLDSVGLEYQQHNVAKQNDINILRSTLETVTKAHYPCLSGRIAIRLVTCSSVCLDSLNILTGLCPYGAQSSTQKEGPGCFDMLSPSVVPIFAVASSSYEQGLSGSISKANQVYKEFCDSEEGSGFAGEVILIGDMIGGLLAFDAVLRHKANLSRNPSSASAYSDVTDVSATIPEDDVLAAIANSQEAVDSENEAVKLRKLRISSSPDETDHSGHGANPERARCPSEPLSSRRSYRRNLSEEVEQANSHLKFDFQPSELFLFGAPLGLILAYRQISGIFDVPKRPHLRQVYNMFYVNDPCCSRIEPILVPKFARIVPVNVPRYHRFPLGDGQSLHLVDCIERHGDELFTQKPHVTATGVNSTPPMSHKSNPNDKHSVVLRRLSSYSENSDNEDSSTALLSSYAFITSRWWGTKRIDFALYSPEGLQSFPVAALPSILHASFWESTDVAAFILRQFVTGSEPGDKERNFFSPSQPTEKWKRRQTSIKIKNSSANHRANDVIVGEDQQQILQARFMYGSLDLVALSGEMVDIYVMTEPDNGEWVLFGTNSTDNHGRLIFEIPEQKRLSLGLHPVKIVVKGDHTYLDMYLAVIPPQTECVVFSIDGSFTASVSVSGKDPKVRPCAVDVARHWQELGYLIIYITARPDMQQRRVISWLAQHNFPHGLLHFSDGISRDPLRQKTEYLRALVSNVKVILHCGYGSAKDIAVYREVDMPIENIFVIGKASKKHYSMAQILSDGYAAHLAQLISGQQSVSRPAKGNGRLVLTKGYFNLPGQLRRVSGSNTVQRSQSFTPRSGKYDSTNSPASAKTLTPEYKASSIKSRAKPSSLLKFARTGRSSNNGK